MRARDCWSISRRSGSTLGERWLAATVPGWTATSLDIANYQPRYLLDSGQVFFDSADPLVSQATNGLMDVYEYEPEGVPIGSPYACTKLSMTFTAGADWLRGVGFLWLV